MPDSDDARPRRGEEQDVDFDDYPVGDYDRDEIINEGLKEASSAVFDRWMGKASENIEKWGVQEQQTLLLALQEELGELTQAYLESTHEDGDPSRIDEELDDLGALLLQLHEARQERLMTDGGTGRLGDEDRQSKPPITDCCGAPVKLAFYGKLICSKCRAEWGSDGFGGASA